jgi:acyl-homoserine lactone acylase PvdQ
MIPEVLQFRPHDECEIFKHETCAVPLCLLNVLNIGPLARSLQCSTSGVNKDIIYHLEHYHLFMKHEGISNNLVWDSSFTAFKTRILKNDAYVPGCV